MKHQSSVTRLAARFRSDQATRPVVLLGAGASFRSGIPLAADLVKLIARHSYAFVELGDEQAIGKVKTSDWRRYLEGQGWFINDEKRFAENFPLAVQHLLKPQDFRRRFFMQIMHGRGSISEGYHRLAEIMAKKLCWTVLTTNFDSILADALWEKAPHIRHVIEINRAKGDIDQFSLFNHWQVVYLHGAVEFYRDQNLINETQQLDATLVTKLRPLMRECPLVVVGYRGAETSVMRHLIEEGIHECDGYRHGIYWCSLPNNEAHPSVTKLAERLGQNFIFLEIEDFDRLFCDLAEELKDDTFFLSSSRGASQTSDGSLSFDARPVRGATVQDLDSDLILSTLVTYSQRLKYPQVTRQNLSRCLEDLQLTVKEGDKVFPTAAGILLFGKQPQQFFTNSFVAFITKGKKQEILQGNLFAQFEALIGRLSGTDVNETLRIKTGKSSEEKIAYPERALTELAINLLIHRDYEREGYSRVDFEPGRLLKFTNPGGLMPKVLRATKPKQDGNFEPVRGVYEMRNPILADIVYGLGNMDKAGTGLDDVKGLMPQHGGRSEFFCLENNQSLSATLLQAFQRFPRLSRVALPVSVGDTFITNLLPFRVLPSKVYKLPKRDVYAERLFFDSVEEAELAPIYRLHEESIVTFSPPNEFPDFAKKHGLPDSVKEEDVCLYLTNKDLRRIFVSLLAKHWKFYLYRFEKDGLVVDRERKRAFFCLRGSGPLKITYKSRVKNRATREVVKQRGTEHKPWFENEGFYYAIVEMDGTWALQLKPTYVFTRSDGSTPLPPFLQTSRATRRMKFDRNVSVDHDLVFWASYLSRGTSAINIGESYVTDIILDTNYVAIEVPAIRELQ